MERLWDGEIIEGIQTYAELIYNQVTMNDVISLYAPNPAPRKRRIPCPLHNGSDYNFSFSENGFCCFVCGRTGGVIRFVMEMFGLDREGAMRKLNRDFGLGLPFDRKITVREQSAYNNTAAKLKQKRQKVLEIEAAQRERYWKLWDEWIALDKLKRYLRPTDPDAPADPNWAYAVNRITYVQYLMDATL